MFSFTFTLTTLALPSLSVANSSITGPSFRHGPQVGAQKSIRTGLSWFKTSVSKFVSFSSTAIFFSLESVCVFALGFYRTESYRQLKQSLRLKSPIIIGVFDA